MRKSVQPAFLAFVVLVVLLNGCAPASTPVPATSILTSTPSPIPPTSTPESTATATTIPSPTPLPGNQTIPITSMKSEIPWLPMQNVARPGISYLGFNTVKPPFDNPIVRQAFVAATDRSAVVEIVNKYTPERKAREATTLTPPEVLGQDLVGFVGIPFNPEHAKELLVSAGYTDPKKFPPATIFVRATGGGDYPGLPLKIAEAIADSWRKTLGVEVIVSATAEKNEDRFSNNPPDFYRLSWAADYNDPDNFLRDLLLNSETYMGEYNYGKFNNADFANLVEQARNEKDPATRQTLYIQAEQILTEQEAAIIPLYYGTFNIP